MHYDKKLLIGGIVLILAVLGALFWYMSTHPAPETPEPVETGTPAESGTITENEQYWEIETNYPPTTPLKASAGAQADAHAVAVMKEFETNSIASFKEENGLNDLSIDDITMQRLDEGRKYAFGMDYQEYTSPSTVSYVYLIYADTLGAHPNAYYRTFTFDLETGAGLVLGDLFVPGSDYVGKLSEISREQLIPQIAKAENVSEAEIDRSMIDAGTTADEDNFQNFYLEENYLVIIFAPYQVGPWALGEQEVRIPKTALATMLKAQYK